MADLVGLAVGMGVGSEVDELDLLPLLEPFEPFELLELFELVMEPFEPLFLSAGAPNHTTVPSSSLHFL